MTEAEACDVLGLVRDASTEEVKRAFRALSKVRHPDVLGLRRSARDVERDHEAYRRIVEEYEILKKRSAFEHANRSTRPRQTGTKQQSPRRSTGQRPPKNPNSAPGSDTRQPKRHRQPPHYNPIGPLKPGVGFWDSLGKDVQQRLKGRFKGNIGPQFCFTFTRTRRPAIATAVAIGGVIGMALLSRLVLWSPAMQILVTSTSLLAGLLCGWAFTQFRERLACKIEDGVFVTPLYLVRTYCDQVRYYPLWDLRTVLIKQRYPTARIHLKFNSGYETLEFPSEAKAAELIQALRLFGLNARRARSQNDISYLVGEDDFRAPPPTDTRFRAAAKAESAIFGLAIAMVFLIVGGVLRMLNERRFAQSAETSAAVSLDVKSERDPHDKLVNASFETSPTGATVVEDARVLGTTPLNLEHQKAGRHEFHLRYLDWPEIVTVVDLQPGQNPLVYTWPHGAVRIETIPEGAEVWVGAKKVGLTPLELPSVRAGPVAYSLTREGYDEAYLRGVVKDRQVLLLRSELVDLRRPGSISVTEAEDSRTIRVRNTGDSAILISEAQLYNWNHQLKDSVRGPWHLQPGAECPITFSSRRESLDFYSFASVPKQLTVEVVSDQHSSDTVAANAASGSIDSGLSITLRLQARQIVIQNLGIKPILILGIAVRSQSGRHAELRIPVQKRLGAGDRFQGQIRGHAESGDYVRLWTDPPIQPEHVHFIVLP